MGQVTVTLNGRTYRLHCGDGEEKRVQQLARHVAAKMETLVDEFGGSGHDRLLVMTALLVADELFEVRDRSRGVRDNSPPVQRRSDKPARRDSEPEPSAPGAETTAEEPASPPPDIAPRRESA